MLLLFGVLIFSSCYSEPDIPEDVDCPHDAGYHDSLRIMENYVGHDDYMAWHNEQLKISSQMYKNKESDCTISQVNILKFAEDFNISEENFKRLYFNSNDYYFVDFAPSVIYSEDYKVVNNYYMSGGQRDEDMQNRGIERTFKHQLITDFMGWDMNSDEYYNFAEYYDKYNNFEWFKENVNSEWQYVSYTLWSIADFVRDLNISRDDFSEFYFDFMEENPEFYSYDLDKIYYFDIERYDAEARSLDGRGWRIDMLLRYDKYNDDFEYDIRKNDD